MNSSYSEYKYDSLEPRNAESGRRLADLLIRIIEGINGVEQICDLGCGNGYLASLLANRGYYVTGIDASQSGVALASSAYPSDRLEFICAEIKHFFPEELLNKQFDLVISSDVIEHLYRPSDLVETAKCLLRPGGHLVIATPYHGYLKNLLISILDKWDRHHAVDWDGGHIKFFSVRTLRTLVGKNGFTDIRFCYYGRMVWLWKNMICHARKG